MKNILKLFGIAAYALATIGGFGYCAHLHKWLIAIAIVVLAVMAWPTFVKLLPKKEE